MGTIPMLAARLARATFEPDLLVSDGEAFFVANDLPLGGRDKLVEGWIPFRSVFDTLWGGRRHVMMGASQMDRLRQLQHRQHRPVGQAEGAAARRARRPGQHRQPRHQLLDPEALDEGLHRARRHGQRPGLRPRRRARRLGHASPRAPSGGHRPGRAGLRRRHDAAALGAPRRERRRRSSPPPGSSCVVADDVPTSRAPDDDGARGTGPPRSGRPASPRGARAGSGSGPGAS